MYPSPLPPLSRRGFILLLTKDLSSHLGSASAKHLLNCSLHCHWSQQFRACLEALLNRNKLNHMLKLREVFKYLPKSGPRTCGKQKKKSPKQNRREAFGTVTCFKFSILHLMVVNESPCCLAAEDEMISWWNRATWWYITQLSVTTRTEYL